MQAIVRKHPCGLADLPCILGLIVTTNMLGIEEESRIISAL
jgi:hypothetical protein